MPDSMNQHDKKRDITCLVIDDNEPFRQIAVTFLGRYGIAVDEAENGEVALGKYIENSNKYDFILLDIQMPVMNGYEVLQAIRTSGMSNSATIPIIGISGASNIASINLFSHFLRKPFTLDSLLAVIKQEIRLD